MYSGGAFCEAGFCEHEFTPVDESAFGAFLADVTKPRCWLLEIEALSLATPGGISSAYSDAAFSEAGFCSDEGASSGGAVTLLYSSHGYTSHSTDLPARTWYDGRIAGEVTVERAIAGRDGIGGLARVFAEVQLANLDGGLDALLRDYALDGRMVTVLLGGPDDARDTYGVVFRGVVDSLTATEAALALRLSDGLAKLDRPIQDTTYAGSGALEGGADLKDKPKPEGWGKALNIAPPLVDSTKLIYQVRDGAINDVPEVRDRGIALIREADYGSAAEMNATAPTAGRYRVWPAGGYFRLGATPAGTVTCDAELDASGAGYVNRTGDILLRILGAFLTSSEINPTSFVQLNADAPGAVGIWIGAESRTVADVMDELLAGIGAFGGFSRLGTFTVGVVAAPAGISVASYSEQEIPSIEREPLPGSFEPVAWRVLVGYQRNYTPQTDLAAAVTAAVRTFAAQMLRIIKREDAALKSRRLLATEYGPTPGLFALQADADTEAQRLFDLWANPRACYRVPLPAQGIVRDLGDVVTIAYPRFGLTNGVQARVIGHRISGLKSEIKVIV